MHTCRTRYPISEIFTQFGELIVKMLRMPVRNSALHCVVRTFIHIDVDLPRAPTAAQKESLPEIQFCKSSPSRWHHLNSRSRVSRPFYFRVVTHGNISAPPEFQLYFKKSDCAQSRFSRKTRRASYPVRPWADHPAPPMPVAPANVGALPKRLSGPCDEGKAASPPSAPLR